MFQTPNRSLASRLNHHRQEAQHHEAKAQQRLVREPRRQQVPAEAPP